MSENINIGAISEALNNKVDLNSNWNMPSSRSVDLVVGASGTQYIAPSKGYYVSGGSNYGAVSLTNLTNKISATSNCITSQGPFDGSCYVNCNKGDVVILSYSSGVVLRFVYAQDTN